MPRKPRIKSNTGIYHIMLRGVNRQLIFEDDEDRERFWQTLKNYKSRSGYEVYGYCLMDNHVHLLMGFKEEDIAIAMKRIIVSYVYYYNLKYGRTGHLFQDRYKSQPVENDEYLLTSLRYIHRNPIEENLCEKPEGYVWSSYNEYLKAGKRYDMLTDVKLILGMISLSELKKYTSGSRDDEVLGMEPEKPKDRLRDEEVLIMMRKLSGCRDSHEFHDIDKETRNKVMKKLHKAGAGFNQLCRVTGWSQPAVTRALDS